MSKIHTLFGLLIFIIALFSIDMIFDNILLETFRGGGGGGGGNRGLGVRNRSIELNNSINNNVLGDDDPTFYRFAYRFRQHLDK